MPNSGEQVDIFPTIARIVIASFQSSGDLVTHDAIVAELLTDSEAASIIARAKDQSPEPHTADWIAHNMVASFSQRITVGQSHWGFEREKIDGKWVYRPKEASDRWDSDPPPTTGVSLKHIDWFDARGMRRVYGRGDHCGRMTFNMDVWRNRDGRLMARFWSRNAEVDGRSIEVVGILPNAIPDRAADSAFSDVWIPEPLRQEYEDWIQDEW